MCGRYVLEGPVDRLLEHFQANLWDPKNHFQWTNRYNIAPTSQVPVIRLNREGKRVLIPHQWGLVPSWAKDTKISAKLNNARAETIFDKPSFRTPVRRFRCLVPATGYYEWQAPTKPGHSKRPWYIKPVQTGLFAMAGVCDHWTNDQGDKLLSFAVVTCGAHPRISHIHDRMPVMIQQENWAHWLDTALQDRDDLSRLLLPSGEVSFHPVSTLVSAAGKNRRDDEELIAPISQPGQTD